MARWLLLPSIAAGSGSLSIRPLTSHEDQQIIRLRHQVKQQKHRLHELRQSLGRRHGGSTPQQAPHVVLASQGRFSEAKATLAAIATPRESLMSQVDEMRWQMGLQLNCSATDWLNSTDADASGPPPTFLDAPKLWLVTFLSLATAIACATLGRSGATQSRGQQPRPAAAERDLVHDGNGMWRLQPHWAGDDAASASASSAVAGDASERSEDQGSESDNFLGTDFGPAEVVAEGVLAEPAEPAESAEPEALVPVPTLQLEPARCSTPPLKDRSPDHWPSPQAEFIDLAIAAPPVAESVKVWFAGPEGPRRALTEAELNATIEPKKARENDEILNLVHMLEEEKPIDDQAALWSEWPWGFSGATGRWADEVLADEEGGFELPQPSLSPRADPWPEKPSRSQQRRRQRKNSKAKAIAAREGAGAAGAGAAPAMVLQLEQLLMLPPQPIAQPQPQLLMAEVVPVTGMVLPAPLVMPMQPLAPLAPPPAAAPIAPAAVPAAAPAAGEAAEVGTTQWSPPEVTPERRRRRQRSRAPLPPRSGRQWRGRRSVEVEALIVHGWADPSSTPAPPPGFESAWQRFLPEMMDSYNKESRAAGTASFGSPESDSYGAVDTSSSSAP